MSDKKYYRLMLGERHVHADACIEGGFVGADIGIDRDLSNDLSDNWREFNDKFCPIWLEGNPDKSRIAAGAKCGALWTVAKDIGIGDILMCPDRPGRYHVAEVIGDYEYKPGEILPHRRAVRWTGTIIDRSEMSESLQNSSGCIRAICQLNQYGSEIESLITGAPTDVVVTPGQVFEDPSVFQLESHLEEFLVQNWEQTELGNNYDIFEEDGELIGQQYRTDTGRIDILGISKDRSELLVVELKQGRASDQVIGQIHRYMGDVQAELAEEGQTVRGVIIALEGDLRLQRALTMTSNIEFYKYEVSFDLNRETYD